MAVDYRELAGRLEEPDSGFSVRTQTGYEPTSGYMVSQAERNKQFPPGVEVADRHLEHYAQQHADFLNRRGRYFGAWRNPDTMALDLDVSRRHTNKDRAYASMISENQDAIYDLGTGRSIRNYAKLGTAGTALGRYVQDEPLGAAEYGELQTAARQRLHSRRPRS